MNKKPYCQFFLSLTPDLMDYFRKETKGCDANIYPDPLSEKTIDKKTEILGVFVDSKVTKKIIATMPHLKLIITFSTGFDHIDLRETKRRGITVCNVPTYGTQTVAEHALTLMLALSKNLFESAKRVKGGVYDYHGLRGFDLEGKTIGIVGTGRIGSRLVELLQPFRCTILAYDTTKQKELVEKFGVRYVSKKTIFEKSDILSLHLPLFPATKHMINKAAIKQMKKGIYIINTARGGLIHSESLVWGLQKGIVAGAGLDVLDQENLLEDPLLLCDGTCSMEDKGTTLMNNILIDHPKTIVTPHTAFNTTEAVKRILSISADNIRAFLKGVPKNVVR